MSQLPGMSPCFDRIICLAAFAFLFTGCAFVRVADERMLNKVVKKPPYTVSRTAARLHESLCVADLHADSLMFDRGGVRGIQKMHDYGVADLPRLQKGGVVLQMLTVAARTPEPYREKRNGGIMDAQIIVSMFQGWPARTWFSPRQRALYQAEKWRANADGAHFVPVRSRDDLQKYLAAHCALDASGNWTRKPGAHPVATILGLEGSHALGLRANDSDEMIAVRVKEFHDAGFRVLAPTHRFDNELGGASEGSRKYGLTPLGARIVMEMARQGFIIDLAHASHRTIQDVLGLNLKMPILVSHAGVPQPPGREGGQVAARVLEMDDARAIAARGGIIGIGIWEEAIGKADAGWTAEMMAGLARDPAVGPRTIVLGSDMDGACKSAFTAAGWPLMTEALLNQKLSVGQVRDLMGGNTLRFLLRSLP